MVQYIWWFFFIYTSFSGWHPCWIKYILLTQTSKIFYKVCKDLEEYVVRRGCYFLFASSDIFLPISSLTSLSKASDKLLDKAVIA